MIRLSEVFVPSFSFTLNLHTLLLFKIYIIKEKMFLPIVSRANNIYIYGCIFFPSDTVSMIRTRILRRKLK